MSCAPAGVLRQAHRCVFVCKYALAVNVKVLVIGNGGVGKSSMAARYCKGVFTSSYKKTIGVDYLEKKIESDDGQTVNMMVWDTAGQEEFDSVTRGYYRGANACALVFSTVDRASFESIERWLGKVTDNCDCRVFALVQNKMDLADESVVRPDEAEALARKLGMPLFRTCVKDNSNVNELFEHLASTYILGMDGDSGPSMAVAAMGDYAGTGTGSAASSATEGSGKGAAAAAAGSGSATGAAGGSSPVASSASASTPVEAQAPAPAPVSASASTRVAGDAGGQQAPSTASASASGGAGSAGAGASLPSSLPSAAPVPAPAPVPVPAPAPAPAPAAAQQAGTFKLTAEPNKKVKKSGGAFGWC